MKLLKANKKAAKCSTQKSGKPTKLAKPARVIPIRPVDEAAAQVARVQKHLTELHSINCAYAESTLSIYADGETSIAEKKAEFCKNMEQLGATPASWHCRALDLLDAGNKLKLNFADQHAELEKALAYFGGPKMN
jgi:hypothetical protein